MDINNWSYASLLPYLGIPLVSAFIGWFTNLLALRMTFYPINYKGIRPFGWQGIIPSKAAIMAGKAVDLLTSKLLDVREIFSRLEPTIVAELMKEEIEQVAKKIVDEVMAIHVKTLWENLPYNIRQPIYHQAAKDLPEVTEALMTEIKLQITELLDIKKMVIESLSKDKELLNTIFLECGREEFKFIKRSGFFFGLILGLVQMTVWYFFSPWWLLPLAGLLVGYLTNWLALKMIFEPVKPIRFMGITFVGLFIKRQKEVAEEYARLVSGNILTTPQLFEAIIRGNSSTRLTEIAKIHVDYAVDKVTGIAGQILKLSPTKTYDTIKNIACYRFLEELPLIIRRIYAYAEETLDLERTLRDKMTNLPGDEFQSFLRPVFQEDEFKLILVGACLGCLAGFIQLWLLF